MTDKKKADQTASPNTSQLNDNSSYAQRARLLERLQSTPVDTIAARRELNVLHPAARVQELRDRGHDIRTQRITLTDDQGHTHHGIALYYLATKPTGRATA